MGKNGTVENWHSWHHHQLVLHSGYLEILFLSHHRRSFRSLIGWKRWTRSLLTRYYLVYLELFHLLIQAPVEQVDEIKELSGKGASAKVPYNPLRPPRTPNTPFKDHHHCHHYRQHYNHLYHLRRPHRGCNQQQDCQSQQCSQRRLWRTWSSGTSPGGHLDDGGGDGGQDHQQHHIHNHYPIRTCAKTSSASQSSLETLLASTVSLQIAIPTRWTDNHCDDADGFFYSFLISSICSMGALMRRWKSSKCTRYLPNIIIIIDIFQK